MLVTQVSALFSFAVLVQEKYLLNLLEYTEFWVISNMLLVASDKR